MNVHWASIDGMQDREEIFCDRCTYSLRGFQESRCPECGLEFSWDDVLNPDRRPHRILFEHHGGHHRVRRFLITAIQNWIPGRFWRSIRLSHPVFPIRLSAYFAVSMLVGAAILVAGLSISIATKYYYMPFAMPVGVVPAGTRADVLHYVLREATHILIFAGRLALFYAALVLTTTFGMSLFFSTLHDYRVSERHLWRMANYSAAANVLLLAVLVSIAANWPLITIPLKCLGLTPAGIKARPVSADFGRGIVIVLSAHWMYSLYAGGRRYLQIRNWFVILLCSQLISVLVILNAELTLHLPGILNQYMMFVEF